MTVHSCRIAFFDAKPYDRDSFNSVNEREFHYDIRYFKGHLTPDSVPLTRGTDVACIFVNDTANREVIRNLKENGVKLLALRCAGFNNVDLKAAEEAELPVVRVPAEIDVHARRGQRLQLARLMVKDQNGLVRIQPLDELRRRFAHLDAAPRALRVGATVKINLAAEQHGLVAQEADVRGREKGVHLGAALLFPVASEGEARQDGLLDVVVAVAGVRAVPAL